MSVVQIFHCVHTMCVYGAGITQCCRPLTVAGEIVCIYVRSALFLRTGCLSFGNWTCGKTTRDGERGSCPIRGVQRTRKPRSKPRWNTGRRRTPYCRFVPRIGRSLFSGFSSERFAFCCRPEKKFSTHSWWP